MFLVMPSGFYNQQAFHTDQFLFRLLCYKINFCTWWIF